MNLIFGIAFNLPTFDYILVYAKDVFTYKKGNVGFTNDESCVIDRRGDIKEWTNKYLIKGWWKKNDEKLYIEENDRFEYLPNDVIDPKFVKGNIGDFVFTDTLPFGKINFLKTTNIFISKNIYIYIAKSYL